MCVSLADSRRDDAHTEKHATHENTKTIDKKGNINTGVNNRRVSIGDVYIRQRGNQRYQNIASLRDYSDCQGRNTCGTYRRCPRLKVNVHCDSHKCWFVLLKCSLLTNLFSLLTLPEPPNFLKISNTVNEWINDKDISIFMFIYIDLIVYLYQWLNICLPHILHLQWSKWY